MNEKYEEVQQWLETLFGGDVPAYEINSTTVDCLYSLKHNNQIQDRSIALVIDDLQQKAAEYSSEADRRRHVLSGVGLSVDSLSKSGTCSVSTLVSLAQILHTKDCSDTSLMSAMSDLSLMKSRLSESRKLEDKLLAKLKEQTNTASVKKGALKKMLVSLEAEEKEKRMEINKKMNQTAFLQSKAKEYQKHIQKHKETLKSTGVDPTLYHSTLLRRSNSLQESRSKLHSLRAKLDSYQKLPPDLALAQVKLEELRREIAKLEEEIMSQVDLKHL